MNTLSKDRFLEACDRFLEACGGTGQIKVLLENCDTKAETVFVFDKPSILVGQHADADIRLRDPAVAKRHLYFQLLDGRLFVLSLAGPTTTHSSAKAITAGWVTTCDTFHLGRYALRFVEGIPSATAVDAACANPLVSSPNGVPPVCLEYRDNPARAVRGMVNRPLSLVGSSELCKFRIVSDRVSSVHCSLVRTSEEIWAVDLGGRNGFRLNGVSSRVACLEEGDRFELGGIGFNIHFEMPAPPLVTEPPLVDEVPAPPPLPLVDQRVEPVVIPKPVLAPPVEREAFERLLGPVLDHFAAFQNQTFQQFQELLGNVLHMFGSMFREQQDFVREEMRRFDRLTEELAGLRQTLKTLPADTTAPPDAEPVPDPPEAVLPPPAPEPRVDPGAPVTEPDMHVWLQARIGELHEQRKSLWTRLMGILRRGGDAR